MDICYQNRVINLLNAYTIPLDEVASAELLIDCIEISYHKLITWCKQLKAFTALPLTDQIALIKGRT